MKKSITFLSLVWITALVLMGCTTNQQNQSETENETLHIVTSMFPMYEITKEVVGDRAELSVMVGANEDAHHYEPSAQAVASVNEADIFVYSSDEMEFWVESLLAVVENDDLVIVELGEGIDFTLGADEEHDHDEEYSHNHEGHNHGSLDPHFWLNPVAVDQQLPLLIDALIEKDEAGKEVYEAEAARLSEELQQIDRAYHETFDTADNRTFVVQHQAFGHLAHQYDLEQVAVGGLTTEVEPSPKKLAEIVTFVSEQEVPVIYYQSGENSAIAETIANETDTDVGVLYDLEGAPADFENSSHPFLDAMKENLEQLKKSIH